MRTLATLIIALFVTSPALAEPNIILQQELADTSIQDPIYIIPSGSSLEFGSSGERVFLLTSRLKELNYQIEPTTVFDKNVDKVVRQYQEDNSLNIDGVVADQTTYSLNITQSSAKVLLEQSLEEWRKVNHTGRHIVVNIPAFELIAYENDTEIFRSKIIVGSPQHQTPRMLTNAWALKYNPDWRAPPGIRSRYAAKWNRGEREYFKKHGIQVFWQNGAIQFYQSPSSSYLGKLKVELDNPYNVYLHDTDSREKFSKATRALSNGCIRVDSYLELGAWLLKTDKDAIQVKINRGKTTWDKFEPVPVYVVYMLAYPTKNGKIAYFRDVYRKF